MANSIFVIDASAFIFRAYHALQPLSSKGRPSHAVAGFASTLLKLIRDQRPATCLVVFDSKKPSFRKTIDPRYKSHRPPPPEDLSGQIEAVRKMCEAAHFPILQEEGMEADDWIASFVKAQAKGERVVVVSTDKDLMQLVNEDISLFDAFKEKFIGPREVEEKFGVKPEQISDFLSLTGDSSDNIAGLSGVGPKTAAKWLNDFGSLDQLLKRQGELPAKIQEKLSAEREELELSRRLVALKVDLPIPDFSHFKLEFPLSSELKNFLADWDCKRALENFAELFQAKASSVLESGHASDVAGISENSAEGERIDSKPSARLVLIESEVQLKDLEKSIRAAGTVTIDIETDSFNRFSSEIVGISFAFSSTEAFYLPWRHSQSAPDLEMAKAMTKRIVEDESIRKIGHNLKFETEVFYREGIALRGPLDDTMLEAYLLHSDFRSFSLDALSQEFLGKQKGDLKGLLAGSENFATIPLAEAVTYAANDAHLTFELHAKLSSQLNDARTQWLYSELEIPMMGILAGIERRGISVDIRYLEELSTDFHHRMRDLEKRIYDLAGETFNIQSPKQLQKILFENLKLTPKKKTKTGFSTDESVLQDLAFEHPLPEEILRFRGLAKLTSTYVDVLPTLVASDGRIHTNYHQTGTVTGRLSSSDPNLQNIPTRSEEGHKIRRAFVAAEGCALVSADYSQVELRIFASMAEDESLVEAFRSGRDIHAETARVIFGSGDKEFRERAKAINYGIVYGISAYGLSQQLKISIKEASQFMEAYFASFPRLKLFMESLVESTRKTGYAETLFGRRRLLPDITSKNPTLRSLAERMSINAPIQGTAADIMKWAMVRLENRIRAENLQSRILLQVHDELVLEVPEAERSMIIEILPREMSNLSATPGAGLKVPLALDVSHGRTWADL